MRRGWVVLFAAGFLAVVPPALTRAVFSSAGALPANGFTTGAASLSATPSVAIMALEGMSPGDETIGRATVLNAGTSRLRYAMRTLATGDPALAEALVLSIKRGVSDCSRAGFDADGATLSQGPLSEGALGDPAPGDQAGDRTLDPDSEETLCFQVRLTAAGSNALQGTSATATFTFDAEQTANN
jgi:hypothetical protein